MSNDIQINLAGTHGASVTQQVQYGVRFPDDTTAWTTMPNSTIDIEALVTPTHRFHRPHSEAWERVVVERAKNARIDVAEYGAAHQFIKRTVILAVTDTEDV